MNVRKIVQLDEYEYEKLVETAKLNEKQIEEKALEMWKKNGVSEINVKVDIGRDYKDIFSIKCYPYTFYKDEKFVIPEKIREWITKIAKKNFAEIIEKHFGELTSTINYYTAKKEKLDMKSRFLTLLAASGWAVAAIVLLLK